VATKLHSSLVAATAKVGKNSSKFPNLPAGLETNIAG